MPFKQGEKPALTFAKSKCSRFRGDLFACGYRLHTGPRIQRNGEIQAWIVDIGRGRQVHVQEVRRADGRVDVYAHTEPRGIGLAHALCAVFDCASYQGGARALKSDLRARGWKL